MSREIGSWEFAFRYQEYIEGGVTLPRVPYFCLSGLLTGDTRSWTYEIRIMTYIFFYPVPALGGAECCYIYMASAANE